MPCNACLVYDSRENAIGRTTKRLFKAIWNRARSRRVANNPRIHCHVCDVIVPPENVVQVPSNIQDGSGAVDEAFLGAVFAVTCHGETDNVYVTLVSQLVDSRICCIEAFRPQRERGSFKKWQAELDVDRKALGESKDVQKAKDWLQVEIAQANQLRARFMKDSDIVRKVRELEALIGALTTNYEQPGVMAEAVADALEVDDKLAFDATVVGRAGQ